MTTPTEPREFHIPGQLSTWFRRFFTPRDPAADAEPMALDQRRTVIDELARERAAREEQHPRLQTRVDAARVRVAEARELLRLNEEHLSAAEGEELAASCAHDLRVSRLEARLRAGASHHLEEFCHDVRDQLEALRTRQVDVHESWGRKDLATERRPHLIVSNLDSFGARGSALRAALAEAEALLLEAISDDEIVARLTALRDGIPEVQPLLHEVGDPLTPAERREIAWQEEAR